MSHNRGSKMHKATGHARSNKLGGKTKLKIQSKGMIKRKSLGAKG